MTRLRWLLVAAGLMILGMAVIQPAGATISTLRSQIAVTIVVIVTPASPVAYDPNRIASTQTGAAIKSTLTLQGAAPALAHEFQAQSLHFDRTGAVMVAQAKQGSILVQAEVTPNPNATLLYSNLNAVTINATAGTTMQVPCAFTVTVDTTKSWSLDEGLSSDFAPSLPGTDLANNTYNNSSTPLPTSTPYVVYANDGSKWSLAGTGAVMSTYCVTLSLTVPPAVVGGTYSSNAIYSVYF